MSILHSKTSNILRQVISIGIFVLLVSGSIYSGLSSMLLASQSNSGPPGEDMVSSWEMRLRKARLLLPASGIIGYVADWDLPEKQYGAKDQEIEFILSQYTLAPLILVRGADHEIVVGNFNDSGDPEKINNIASTLGLVLETPYSNEFFVFKGLTQ